MSATTRSRTEVMEIGPLEILPEEHLARANGRALMLSIRELRLLTELARRADRIAAREELFRLVWGRADGLHGHVQGRRQPVCRAGREEVLHLRVRQASRDWRGFEPAPVRAAAVIAGLILAIMILPIVSAISREVIATVPSENKEAALALVPLVLIVYYLLYKGFSLG